MDTAYVFLTVPCIPGYLRSAIEDAIALNLSPSTIVFEIELTTESVLNTELFMRWIRVEGGFACRQILSADKTEMNNLEFHLQRLSDEYGFDFSMTPARAGDILVA